MAEHLQNRTRTTLDGAINGSVTTISVIDASDFPGTGDFRIRVGNSIVYELMKVTAVSGNDFTVVRAVETIDGDPSAHSHADGVDVRLVITAGALSAAFDGGGGASISSGPYASLPAAGNVGALYIPNDAPVWFYDNGTYWEGNGYGMPLPFISPPTTAFNPVTETITDEGWCIDIFAPDNGGTGTYRVVGVDKAMPAPPFTVDMAISFEGYNRQYASYGMVTRDSGSGRMICFGPIGGTGLYIQSFNSPSSLNGNLEGAELPMNLTALMWFRIVDDGTNIQYFWSNEGQKWVNFRSNMSRTVWLASPDRIGFFINNQTNFFPVRGQLLAWYEH